MLNNKETDIVLFFVVTPSNISDKPLK
ncbi:uncharacterized protein METZ01_LOCUS474524, partial [marine metagenome]